MGTAGVGRRNGPGPVRLSFPPRHEQVEQGRAPAVFLHLLELARRAVARLRDDRALDCAHDDGEGTQGHLSLGPSEVPDRPACLGRGDAQRERGTARLSWRLELRDPAPSQDTVTGCATFIY